MHPTAARGQARAAMAELRDLVRGIAPSILNDRGLDAALTEIAGPGHHVVLSEELGPAKRYQNWLAVLRGDVKMVIGTRSAMFAPVADLGFVVGESGVAGLAAFLLSAADPASREALGIGPESRVLLFATEGATDEAQYAGLVGKAPDEVRRESARG